MVTRIYLVIVALIYLALAIWCCVQPSETSAKVGLELREGSGQSEFMTVYGGLEFGLALVLLASLFRSDTARFGLLACVLIHASLVLFRTVSLFRFSGIDSFIYQLAVGEWAILLVGLGVLYLSKKRGNILQ